MSARAPSDPLAPDAPVRLVLARLDGDAPDDADFLDDAERTRLQSMRSPQRRRQFVAGRGLARQLAAACAGAVPGDWRVDVDARGAPRLCRRDEGAQLHVSIAHSGDRVACAVAATPLGIDLETAARPRDLLAVAGFVFPAGLRDDLTALDDAMRAREFYRWWALAEAHGKRDGDGLRWQDSRTRRFREVECAAADYRTWQGDGMTLAIALPGRVAVVVDGWDAPAPRYWTAESAGTG